MTSSERIIYEFDRYVEYGHSRMAERPKAEQIIYYAVIARCEKDMEGFVSIFEQGLSEAELGVLIDGLRSLEEKGLANEFQHVVDVLKQEGFYPDRNASVLSEDVITKIKEAAARIGDRLWELDDKLVSLWDNQVGLGND